MASNGGFDASAAYVRLFPRSATNPNYTIGYFPNYTASDVLAASVPASASAVTYNGYYTLTDGYTDCVEECTCPSSLTSLTQQQLYVAGKLYSAGVIKPNDESLLNIPWISIASGYRPPRGNYVNGNAR